MKPKMKITEDDYIKAIKKADREIEIAHHGKQVSFGKSKIHKAKNEYKRQGHKHIKNWEEYDD